jgi:hypothetical protein
LGLLSFGGFPGFAAKQTQEPFVVSRLTREHTLPNGAGSWKKDVAVVIAGVAVNRPLPVAQSTNQGNQEKPASEPRSFMELFTKLERDWTQAVQEKNKTALESILAPEFMLRSSDNPENPLSRADWIQLALTRSDIRSFTHRAMAIRAFLRVAAVSFVQSQHATMDGKDRSGDYFIVDLWEVNNDKWQVCARYITPVSDGVAGATKIQK